MPSGGKLRHLQSQDSETTILEIMYGHGQNQRNSRYFIFTFFLVHKKLI